VAFALFRFKRNWVLPKPVAAGVHEAEPVTRTTSPGLTLTEFRPLTRQSRVYVPTWALAMPAAPAVATRQARATLTFMYGSFLD
jgi:hypothetical protein